MALSAPRRVREVSGGYGGTHAPQTARIYFNELVTHFPHFPQHLPHNEINALWEDFPHFPQQVMAPSPRL
jgi:hypothetical protein